ncbi:MAG: rhomboid family intramembrane serine protease [Flavobacteriales bacterium]|nr:rhomboid family intramembrane serine protease [Flavobacteriales bacterium]
MNQLGRGTFFSALFFTSVFLVVCWILFGLDEVTQLHLRSYGLSPREWPGLRGIITMHFLHGDLKHIAHNSLSFLVLNTLLFYFYRGIAPKVFLWIFVAGPILLWFWGREGNHIGASLLIYGLAAFLFFSGIFRKNQLLLRVALVVAFYYGSIVWYVLPVDPTISWEGHLSGGLVGIILAWVLRFAGPPADRYQYELDEERERLEAEQLAAEAALQPDEDWKHVHSSGTSDVNYEFVPRKNEDQETSKGQNPPKNQAQKNPSGSGRG